MADINTLIASAIPVQPPDDWFQSPGLAHPTAIKVLPNGRVYGHVASWDMDHIGMPFGTRPPKSRSNYAYFKTGEIMTASGELVPVGQLTLAGGHAGLEATAAQAVKHYDDTQSAIADVTVGEDEHGIWVSGALRPDATPEKIRQLRASAPSGDWRLINGKLEMVAVCQVNVPGFPIPRALAAGGQRFALVAAGTAPLLAQVLSEQEFEARLQRLEQFAEARESERLSLVASATKERVDKLRGETLKRQAEEARRRVRDPQTFIRNRTVTAAAARKAEAEAIDRAAHKLAKGELLIDSYTNVQRAVRAYEKLEVGKVDARRTIIAAAVELGAYSALPEEWHERALIAAGSPSQAKRDKAADSGHALPDGSYPINTEDDLRKAVKAYGRAKDKDAAKRHIKKRARALGKADSLPEDWKTSSLEHEDDDVDFPHEYSDAVTEAAGNFKHLDTDFLSRKAEEQPRDNNGRFVQTGAFLRWQTPGKVGYEFGQVIGRKTNPDGTIDVRLADSNTIVKHKPNQVEVIRAILPSDQVDNPNDRGIPFKKKEGRKTPASPSAPGGFLPSKDPAVVESPNLDVDLGGTDQTIPQVGDRVASAVDNTQLGTVTRSDDPTAIEVTDDGGLVTVHDAGELVVVPGNTSTPAAPITPVAPSAPAAPAV